MEGVPEESSFSHAVNTLPAPSATRSISKLFFIDFILLKFLYLKTIRFILWIIYWWFLQIRRLAQLNIRYRQQEVPFVSINCSFGVPRRFCECPLRRIWILIGLRIE